MPIRRELATQPLRRPRKMTKKLKKRIDAVANWLYHNAYESTFGGKSRGKFQITRKGVKDLLGLQRLHPSTVRKLTDACLEKGLVVIDSDDSFAFAETQFVKKWRKLPTSRINAFAGGLNAADMDDEAPDFEPEEEEEDDVDD